VSPRKSPRRTKPSASASLGRFWILIVAIVVLLVAGGAFAEFWPGFYPRHVVVTGNARVDRATIVRAAGIARHRSIWLQSIRTMAANVAAIPFVGKAAVKRYPPATIAIRITERVPFAMVRRGENQALVDDTLRVLEDAPDARALPVFVLPGGTAFVPGSFLESNDALTLRNVYTMLASAAFTPAMLTFDRYGQVEVTTASGVRMLLGEPANLDDKVRLCSAIVAQLAAHGRKPATIDVRAPSTPVVTYATRG
jgi:cell division septal protein FtsQ